MVRLTQVRYNTGAYLFYSKVNLMTVWALGVYYSEEQYEYC